MPTMPTFAATATRLHGEIIAWDVPLGTKVPYATIVNALAAAGLEKGAAREIAPRDAFARACWALTESRIIRRVAESAGELKFQFTRENVVDGVATATGFAPGKRLSYDFEAVLTLDKVTGVVTCDDSPDLAGLAQAHVNAATEVRTTRDISRMIQRLFDANADLFPVRSSGGCYFVPVAFADFLASVGKLLAALGGSLRRFPVPAGYADGDRSVAESVRDGMARTIEEHMQAVADFDPATREATLTKMVEKLNVTRFKAEAYAEFLADQKAEIDDLLKDARQTLRDKIATLSHAVDVPEPTYCAATWKDTEAAVVVGPYTVAVGDGATEPPLTDAERDEIEAAQVAGWDRYKRGEYADRGAERLAGLMAAATAAPAPAVKSPEEVAREQVLAAFAGLEV